MLRSSTKLFVQALRTPLVRARSTVAQSVTQGSVCATKDSSQACIGQMMEKLHSDKLPSNTSAGQFDLRLFQQQDLKITFNTPHIQTEALEYREFGKSMTGC